MTMKKMQLGLIGLAAVLLFVPSIVRGATIKAGIDGSFVDVPTFILSAEDGGNIAIGTSYEDPQFVYDVAGVGKVVMQGELKPDPFISFAVAVTDPGAASTFSFSYVLPLAPTVMNPSFVKDSLSGSVTNGVAPGGVTVTALAPPAAIPTDGDGIDELQVFTLSDDGGVTYKNVGLDAGPTTPVPLGSSGSGLYGAYNQGPIATIAGGPWTHMRVDLNFGLSGGGDIFTLNGGKELFTLTGNIPEPSSLLLGVLAAALIGLLRKR